MSTVWNIYTWIAVVSFTFSLFLVFWLFVRSELDIRARKKKMIKFDADLQEIVQQEENRERLRQALGYAEEDNKED